METLPIEMAEKIVQQLTPQDLARCSAVCREWREIFNQDWMWEPHCDPELEEPLRTIPCIATPVFVSPVVENSTLPPLCHWRLAFMRENHLWKNWRSTEKKVEYKKENVINFDKRFIISIVFLTDTLLVAWYSNHIEVLDASVMPPASMAKISVSAGLDGELSAIGPNMILLVKDDSVEVFNVDIMNRSIVLKHSISLDRDIIYRDLILVTKEHFYLTMNHRESKLVIFDLNTGKILKEEPYPVKLNENESVGLKVYKTVIIGIPNSNLVVIAFEVFTGDSKECCKYYIYNYEKLTFLPGPVAVTHGHGDCRNVALHDHWLAVTDDHILKVYDIHTREVLLSHEVDFGYHDTYVCSNRFVFVGYEKNGSWAKTYHPVDKTLATLCESGLNEKLFGVINNKFVALFGESLFSEGVWKASAKAVTKCDISIISKGVINQSFTKVLGYKYFQNSGTVERYVSSLW